MKSFKLLRLLMALAITTTSFAQLTLPPGGGNQRCEVTQYLGLVKVTIVYNSPDVAGREIWGKLVPYGPRSHNCESSPR